MEGLGFTKFMNAMLQTLEDSLNAPRGSFLFVEGNETVKYEQFYLFREVDVHGATYCVGFHMDLSAGCGGCRFLLNLAVQEVCDLISDGEMFRRSADAASGKWAFDLSVHNWHNAETLARQIHEGISHQTFSWLRRCLGLDPFIMSGIVDMSYESDAARGRFVFWTGKPDDSFEMYQLCPNPDVFFIEGNARFIRKQLAGAGDDYMLFTRDNADFGTKYVYRGYLTLSEPSNTSDRKKLPVSVLLLRGGGWILQIDEQPIFCIKHANVYLPPDDLTPVKETIDCEFGKDTAKSVSTVLEALRSQKHGTSIIFLKLSDQASLDMMKRLEETGRALRVEDVHTNKGDDEANEYLNRFLRQVSRVDGAQIFDLDAKRVCYVNAIVDGFALVPGKRDCGARHNALEGAITNLVNQEEPAKKVKAVAVIFSEDGGISAVSASQCRRQLNQLKPHSGSATAKNYNLGFSKSLQE